MPKLTFDEALERIAEQRLIRPEEVQTRALRRRVYVMMYSAPGCLPDHSSVSPTRWEAIEDARELYADDAPRGFITQLRRHGIAATDEQGYYRVEISRQTLADCF